MLLRNNPTKILIEIHVQSLFTEPSKTKGNRVIFIRGFELSCLDFYSMQVSSSGKSLIR